MAEKATKDRKQVSSLKWLTGHRAGALLFPDGTVWVGNWARLTGAPRLEPDGTPLEPHVVGTGELLDPVSPTAVPERARAAMIQHDLDNGGWGPQDGYHAWEIQGRVIVIAQDDWN